MSPKRQNYYLQEKFFAAEMIRIGIEWKVAFIDEVQAINGTIFFENKPIDFISFDLEDEDWLHEGWKDIRSRWLTSSRAYSQPIGLPMGIDDKLLLAIVGKDLSLFATTYVVPSELANTQWQNIKGLKEAHIHRDFHAVLKRGGTGYKTTGSSDVFISKDFSPKDWQKIVEKTIKDGESDKWVVQKFIKSEQFQINFRLTPRGKTRTEKAPIRLTAFYIRTNPDSIDYSFTGAIATIGTDREMLLERTNVIRALRDCTYAPVAPYLK